MKLMALALLLTAAVVSFTRVAQKAHATTVVCDDSGDDGDDGSDDDDNS